MEIDMTREEAIKELRGFIGQLTEGCQEVIKVLVPELRESEDDALEFLKGHAIEWIASIEHDISQSVYDGIKGHSPEDERELAEWKKALAWLEKQKESLHIQETCKENADSFTDACKDVIVAIEKYLDWLTGYPDYAPKGKYSLRDMLHCLYVLEKQKEQTSDIILKAFENSKTDYSLEEREEASDYSEKVLPTSIACGESEEEYLLHKVIEAAYIAGQKEQKPPIAGNDFGWIDELKHDLEHPEELDEKVQEVLKKRQKPVERSLEDDHIIGFVYDLLNEIEWKDNWAMSKEECLGRLKSLRPPLKDKEMKLKILKYLSTRCSSLEFEEVENYLNNLRPSWKPSEEQMDALNYFIKLWGNSDDQLEYTKIFNTVKSLRDDLEKLM